MKLLGAELHEDEAGSFNAKTLIGGVSVRHVRGYWRVFWWPKGSRHAQYGVVVTDGYKYSIDAIAAGEKRFREMRRAFDAAKEKA